MARIQLSLGPGLQKKTENVETIVQKEIKNLDYDKFLGTIGLATDKPTSANFPHYTAFPDNPEEGNWLRVVSEMTADGHLLLIDDEWMCVKAKAGANKAIWENIQIGEPTELYPESSLVIGTVYRTGLTKDQIVQPNQTVFIDFGTAITSGAFLKIRILPTTRLTQLGDLIKDQMAFDFFLRIEFSPDSEGERTVGLAIYRYASTPQNPYEAFISRFLIDEQNVNPGVAIRLQRVRIFPPAIDSPNDNPITYAVAAYVRQSSSVPLMIPFAELSIVGYRQNA